MNRCALCNKRANVFDELWLCWRCYESNSFKQLKMDLKGLENLKKTLIKDVEIHVKAERQKILENYKKEL